MSAAAVEIQRQGQQIGEGITHVVCGCSPDVALCGKDMAGTPWTDESTECVVCADLEWEDCPRCGR